MQLNNFFLQSCALSLNLYTQTDSQKAFQIVQDNVIKYSENQKAFQIVHIYTNATKHFFFFCNHVLFP